MAAEHDTEVETSDGEEIPLPPIPAALAAVPVRPKVVARPRGRISIHKCLTGRIAGLETYAVTRDLQAIMELNKEVKIPGQYMKNLLKLDMHELVLALIEENNFTQCRPKTLFVDIVFTVASDYEGVCREVANSEEAVLEELLSVIRPPEVQRDLAKRRLLKALFERVGAEMNKYRFSSYLRERTEPLSGTGMTKEQLELLRRDCCLNGMSTLCFSLSLGSWGTSIVVQ